MTKVSNISLMNERQPNTLLDHMSFKHSTGSEEGREETEHTSSFSDFDSSFKSISSRGVGIPEFPLSFEPELACLKEAPSKGILKKDDSPEYGPNRGFYFPRSNFFSPLSKFCLRLDDYEEQRPGRREKFEMILSRSRREEMLRAQGYGRGDIRECEMEIRQIKKTREANAKIGWVARIRRKIKIRQIKKTREANAKIGWMARIRRKIKTAFH
eukprot:CAMPEP_0198154832 /NCGR_PEP_ID=MMETSP1443-20131203/68816_1 /TAXON_ID=186043 /ORGANISM="Entomoneis sp., Strain CCMP2396" /LENGTH=212 /DNA_ID=CAMNT_0043821547 /DNA_START=744 /DNA_END=1383 /DNA_ORIENTATION=-